MSNNLSKWTEGLLDKTIINDFIELSNKSSLELSKYIPFIRITPIELDGATIKKQNEDNCLTIYLTQSQIQSKNLKGKLGFKNLSMSTEGEPIGIIFAIHLEFDILDPSILNDYNIARLFTLATNLKIEFGWGNHIWDYKSHNTVKDADDHGVNGYEMYSQVNLVEPTINEKGIINIKVKTLSTNATLLMDIKKDNYFNIFGIYGHVKHVKLDTSALTEYGGIWASKNKPEEKIRTPQETEGINPGKTLLSTLSTSGTILPDSTINLQDLILYINSQIKNTMLTKVMTNNNKIILDEKEIPIQSLNTFGKKITLKDSSKSNAQLKDIDIDINIIVQLYNSTDTLVSFLNGLCDSINENSLDTLNLQVQTSLPSGNDIIITNVTQIGKKKQEDFKNNILEHKDQYLPINIMGKNNIIKSLSFPQNLSDGGRFLQGYIDMGGVPGTTSEKTKAITVFNYSDNKEALVTKKDDEWFSYDWKTQWTIEQSSKIKSNKLGSPTKNPKKIEENKNTIQRAKTQNASIFFLPYKLEATFFGFSGLWTGSRLYIDNDCPIPFFKETVWRITSLTHDLTSSGWEVSISAVLEYNKTIMNFMDRVK